MRIKPRLSEDWKKEMRAAIANLKNAKLSGGPGPKIELITPYAKAKQWLIGNLIDNGIPFLFKNAGAGISIITTDVEFCPMCKRPLNPKKEKLT